MKLTCLQFMWDGKFNLFNLFRLKHGFQGLYSELEGFFCICCSGDLSFSQWKIHRIVRQGNRQGNRRGKSTGDPLKDLQGIASGMVNFFSSIRLASLDCAPNNKTCLEDVCGCYVDAIVEMIHDERIIRCDVKHDMSYTRMITYDFI